MRSETCRETGRRRRRKDKAGDRGADPGRSGARWGARRSCKSNRLRQRGRRWGRNPVAAAVGKVRARSGRAKRSPGAGSCGGVVRREVDRAARRGYHSKSLEERVRSACSVEVRSRQEIHGIGGCRGGTSVGRYILLALRRGRVENRSGRRGCWEIAREGEMVVLGRRMWVAGGEGTECYYWIEAGRIRRGGGVWWVAGCFRSREVDWDLDPEEVAASRWRGNLRCVAVDAYLEYCPREGCTAMPEENVSYCLFLAEDSREIYLAP